MPRRKQGIILTVFVSFSLVLQTSPWCFHTRSEDAKGQTLSCFKSEEYEIDLVRSSEDNITNLMFMYSNVTSLKDNAFIHIFQQLRTIVIFQCKLKEIEDHAFAGLSELESLDLSSNLLERIKAVWFDDIPRLKFLILRGNHISDIESTTAAKWANLERLDISGNHLHCLQPNFIAQLNSLRYFNCRQNPWFYKCCFDIMNWALSKEQVVINPEYRNVQDLHNITRECIDELNIADNLSVDACVEDRLNQMILNKTVRNVTVNN